MDVIVKEASGIESDTIVSIRAGSTRRQGRLILDQPFCFPNLLVNASPFNVDLLRNVASAKLNVSPDVEDYEVIFPQTGQTGSMSMTLQLKEDPKQCGLRSKNRMRAGTAVDCAGGNGTWEAAKKMMLDQPEERQATAAAAACAYLDRFNLLNFMQEMLQYIVREKPENPFVSMSEYLQKVSCKTLNMEGQNDDGARDAAADVSTNAVRAEDVEMGQECKVAKTLILQDKSGSEEMQERNLTPPPSNVVEEVTGANIEPPKNVPTPFSTDATESTPETKHGDESAPQVPCMVVIGSAQDASVAPLVEVNECASADAETKRTLPLSSAEAANPAVDAKSPPTDSARDVDIGALSSLPPAVEVKVEIESSNPPLSTELIQHAPETELEPSQSSAEVTKLVVGVEIEAKRAPRPLLAERADTIRGVEPEAKTVTKPQPEEAVESEPELEPSAPPALSAEVIESGAKSAPPFTEAVELPVEVDSEVKNVLSAPHKCVPEVEPQAQDAQCPPVEVTDKSVSLLKPPSPVSIAPLVEVSGLTQDSKLKRKRAPQAEDKIIPDKAADAVQLDDTSVKASTMPDELTTAAAPVEEIMCGEGVSISKLVDQEVKEVKQKAVKGSVEAPSPAGLEEMPTAEPVTPTAGPVTQEERGEKNTPPSGEQVNTKIGDRGSDEAVVVVPPADEKPRSETRNSGDVEVMAATLLPREKLDHEALPELGMKMESTDEETKKEDATVDVVDLISRQNLRLDSENERLRDEIRDIQSYCQTRGLALPAIFHEDTFAPEESSERNRELRAEHDHLCSTLGSFCKGLTELADQLGSAMTTTQCAERSGETLQHGDPVTMPSKSETVIAEETAAAMCERLEEEQKTLMREIRELEARNTPSPTPVNLPVEK